MKWTNILKNTSYQRSLKKKQITLIDPYLLKKLIVVTKPSHKENFRPRWRHCESYQPQKEDVNNTTSAHSLPETRRGGNQSQLTFLGQHYSDTKPDKDIARKQQTNISQNRCNNPQQNSRL